MMSLAMMAKAVSPASRTKGSTTTHWEASPSPVSPRMAKENDSGSSRSSEKSPSG